MICLVLVEKDLQPHKLDRPPVAQSSRRILMSTREVGVQFQTRLNPRRTEIYCCWFQMMCRHHSRAAAVHLGYGFRNPKSSQSYCTEVLVLNIASELK
jgi:hypothetical protein